jgi:hypothetical protein
MSGNVKFKKKTKDHTVGVYSAEAFPVKIPVATAYTAPASSAPVMQDAVDFGANKKFVAINETIYFPSIPGYKKDGVTSDGHCFVADVIGKDSNKRPVLLPRNGVKSGALTNTLPSLPLNTLAIRGVRTGTETQMRTDPFNLIPTDKEYYIQKTLIETGESTWFINNDKEVKWDISEKMEFGMFEHKRTWNTDFWLGKGGSKIIENPYNGNKEELAYFMEGVWYQAGREWEFTGGEIDTDDLVEFCKYVFRGNASSNTKMLFAGETLIAALQKVPFNATIRLGDTYSDDKLKLTFDSILYFGGKKILFTHDPSLDDLGMNNCGYVLDDKFAFEYNYGYQVYDIDDEALRKSQIKGELIIEEKTYIIANEMAHCRVKLAA